MCTMTLQTSIHLIFLLHFDQKKRERKEKKLTSQHLMEIAI